MQIDLNNEDMSLLCKSIRHFMDIPMLTEKDFNRLDDLLFYFGQYDFVYNEKENIYE